MTTRPAADVSYDPAFFAPIAAAEDRHFWFVARRRLIATALRRLEPALPTPLRVLEVGAGTGNVTRTLVEIFGADAVTAMEPHADAVRIARERLPCRVLEGDLDAPPEALGEGFSLIGMFDVLEHLPDERASLRAVRARLAPGGALVLTVPAHPSLWSYFDEEAGHFRRYEVETLERAIAAAGLRLDYATELFSLLYPMMWLGRRLSSLRPTPPSGQKSTGELRTVPVVNDVLTWALSLESRRIAAQRRGSHGTSILAIARA